MGRGRVGTVQAVAIAVSMISLPAAASPPPAQPPQPLASEEAQAAAWTRYERRRRGLIAGVAVSGTVAVAGLAMVFAGFGISARQDEPYANYSAISMVYLGGACFVVGGIATGITGFALSNHLRKRPSGPAIGRLRLQPRPGGLALRF